MKLSLVKKSADEVKDDLLAFFVFQGEKLPKEADPFVRDLAKSQFEGKEGQSYHTSTLGKAKFKSVLLIGLGKKEDFIRDMLRLAAAIVVRKYTSQKIKSAP